MKQIEVSKVLKVIAYSNSANQTKPKYDSMKNGEALGFVNR
jgi:hypothetical protein